MTKDEFQNLLLSKLPKAMVDEVMETYEDLKEEHIECWQRVLAMDNLDDLRQERAKVDQQLQKNMQLMEKKIMKIKRLQYQLKHQQ